MARPMGSPNKDKQALRDRAAAHGVDVVEMRIMLLKDAFKTIDNEIGKPRSRRSKHYFAAVAEADKHLSELTPYLHGKLSNVTVADATPRLTVIRAPEVISSGQEWLEKFRPRRGDMANERPPATLAFAQSLKATLEIADELGISDPQEIVGEEVRLTKRGIGHDDCRRDAETSGEPGPSSSAPRRKNGAASFDRSGGSQGGGRSSAT